MQMMYCWHLHHQLYEHFLGNVRYYAVQFGLTFNAAKTQLICFQRAKVKTFPPTGVITFFGSPLPSLKV